MTALDNPLNFEDQTGSQIFDTNALFCLGIWLDPLSELSTSIAAEALSKTSNLKSAFGNNCAAMPALLYCVEI